MSAQAATCSCGQLKATCEGRPGRVVACNCSWCQRRTGSPFGVGAYFPRSQVRISGNSSQSRGTAPRGARSPITSARNAAPIFSGSSTCRRTTWELQSEALPTLASSVPRAPCGRSTSTGGCSFPKTWSSSRRPGLSRHRAEINRGPGSQRDPRSRPPQAGSSSASAPARSRAAPSGGA
jgi:hypothetical protein